MALPFCYHRASGRIDHWPNLVPCNDTSSTGVSTCCAAGDACLSNGLCHFTHPAAEGSGFYIGACTDPTYLDPQCLQQNYCKSNEWPDIVYSSAEGKWNCCGTDYNPDGSLKGADCSKPSNLSSFDAPSPEQLLANTIIHVTNPVTPTASSSITSSSSQMTSSPSSSSTSQITSSTSSLPSASPLSVTSSNNSDGGLSSGAKAGIGVGVTIAALLIIGLLVWAVLLARRVKRLENPQEVPVQSPPKADMEKVLPQAPNYHELHNRGKTELYAAHPRHELPSEPYNTTRGTHDPVEMGYGPRSP